MSAPLRRTRLAEQPAVSTVLRRLTGAVGLVCLSGRWAGGGALIAADPVEVSRDPAVLARLPELAVGVGGPAAGAQRSDQGPGVGGGWFGLLGYQPAATWLGYYDQLLRWTGRDWYVETLWSAGRAAELARRESAWTELVTAAANDEARPPPDELPAPARSYRAGPFAGAAPTAHLQAIERCITHIRAGDIFQANVALRLHADFGGSALALFADLAERLGPDYASFVDTGEDVLVGLSPELFLRRDGRRVTTSPIKGTRPRTGAGDQREAEVLRRSAKDAAENVMIVDLMRNDLGRVCAAGSVAVPDLLELQAHPGVWHLVSTVTGELAEGRTDADLVAATFPPGSVTGAPKARAVQLIAEHEPAPRRAFAGSVGFAGPMGRAEFNVVIRSFEVSGDQIQLWVGGGITADSVPIEEWRECLTKARPLLTAAGFELAPIAETALTAAIPDPSRGLLETVLVRAGRPVALADHLARLDRSCRELYGLAPPPDLAGRVTATAAGHRHARLRVTAVPASGRLAVELTTAELVEPPGVGRLVSRDRPAGLWRHKYADRGWLQEAERAVGPGALPLFVVDGLVLETSRGNVFAVEGERLSTPPLTDALLPGVTRRRVLDAAFDLGVEVAIEPLPLGRLRGADAVFTTSAISELIHVSALDGQPRPPSGALERALADRLGGH